MTTREPELRTERIELLDQSRVLQDIRERGGRDLRLRLLSAPSWKYMGVSSA
jgi:hypothetical protein